MPEAIAMNKRYGAALNINSPLGAIVRGRNGAVGHVEHIELE